MTLSLLYPSETGKNIPMFQSDADMLLQLFPSVTSTIIPKWCWHYFSQVTLALLFPNISTTSVSRFLVNFNLSGASLEKNRVINLGLFNYKFDSSVIEVTDNISKPANHHNPIIWRHKVKTVCRCSYWKLVQHRSSV